MIAGYILTGGKNRRMNGKKKLFLDLLQKMNVLVKIFIKQLNILVKQLLMKETNFIKNLKIFYHYVWMK